MTPLHKELRFSDFRHLDHHVRLPMLYDALKTIFLVNAAFAVGLGVFYELLQLCQQWDVSPWLSAALYVIGYGLWFRRTCKGSFVLPPNHPNFGE